MKKELSDEAHAKLDDFRQTRSAARVAARGQRDRVGRRLAPGWFGRVTRIAAARILLRRAPGAGGVRR